MSGPPNGQPPVTYPAQAPSNVPFIPPWNPYIMPPGVFDALIAASGVRLLWQKSHLCACTYGGPIPGSPDPACSTCSGRGYYWDSPVGPFVGLITFIHLVTSPDEPGAIMDEKFGQIFRGKPTLTIPYAGAPTVWSQSSTNDIFVEMDALDKFNVELQAGRNQTVPYQHQLSIAASGAVTVYDPIGHVTSFVSGYVVSGATVTLPSGYATGTPYVVELTAAKVYVAWRESGALAHQRPFAQSKEPKRFNVQTLDLWLRGKSAA